MEDIMKKLISIALIVSLVALMLGFVVMGTGVDASETPCADLWRTCVDSGQTYAQCQKLFDTCLAIMYPLQ
jgi:hypothetical protein